MDAAAPRVPLIGRSRERDILLADLPQPHTPQHRRVWVVRGEAGIGKTTLVNSVAHAATQRGCRVVSGASWDPDTAPSHWPWIQVVAELSDQPPTGTLASVVLDGAAPSERAVLFLATAELLASVAQPSGLVVVLEDIHQADAESIELLRFCAARLSDAPILFVATARPAPGGDGPANRELDLLTQGAALLELGGLSEDDIAELTGDREHAATIAAATGGNPLFVQQVLADTLAAPAASLTRVVQQRMSRLSPATARLLGQVGVFSAPPTPAELGHCSLLSPQTVDAAVHEARSAGFIEPDALDGRIRFRHQVMADAAHALLSPTEAEDAHERCAHALAGMPSRATERAHHLLRAGTKSRAEALNAAIEAAAEATSVLACEEAIRLCTTALSRCSGDTPGAPLFQARLYRELSRAWWWRGDHDAAARTADQAWECALSGPYPDILADIAVGPEFRFDFSGDAAALRASRCEFALTMLPAGVARIRVLATLATATIVSDPVRARETAADASTEADRVGDPVATAYALLALCATDLSPETLASRLNRSRRVLALAAAHNIREVAASAYFLLVSALLESGDTRGLDAELAGAAAGTAEGRHVGWMRCTRAILDGDATLAENLANHSLEVAIASQDPDAQSVWAGQISIVRWMQGRAAETEPLLLAARTLDPHDPVWSISLAWVWWSHGRVDAARGVIDSLGPLSSFPRNRNWLAAVCIMAEVAADIGSDELVKQLRDELLPFATRLVSIGLGVAVWGTVAKPLGLLARRLGAEDEAAAHFESAITVSSRAGAQAWLVEAQIELARSRASLGGRADEVAALLTQAQATAEALGFTRLVDRIADLRSVVGEVPDAQFPVFPAGTALETRPQVNVLGLFEVHAVDGSVATWTSRKAREILKIVVASRGTIARETLLHFLWPDESRERLANRFAVAISTVRRALDPDRVWPSDHFVQVVGDVVHLRLDRVDVDAYRFLELARDALAAADPGERIRRALDALATFRGDACADDPYSEWAVGLRTEVRAAFGALARELADQAVDSSHLLAAAEALSTAVQLDEFDAECWSLLADALESLGAQTQADRARSQVQILEGLGR